MNLKILKNKSGDTILEVLISITILTVILGSTFVLANNSKQTDRRSAERGETSALSETQMERLKAYYAKRGSATSAISPTVGYKFCMKDVDTPIPLGAVDPDDPEAYPADCQNGGFYGTYINVDEVTAGAATKFTAFTKWPSASGSGIDQSSVVHKIYPNLALKDNFAPCAVDPTAVGCPCPLPKVGFIPDCKNLPIIRVTVERIMPTGNPATANCSMTTTSGTSSFAQTSIGTAEVGGSDHQFIGLTPGNPYTASYSITDSSKYVACGPTSKPVSAGALDSEIPVTFKAAPICISSQIPTHHYVNVPVYNTSLAYYNWAHKGFGNFSTFQGPHFNSWSPTSPGTLPKGPPFPNGGNANSYPNSYAYEQYHIHSSHGHYFYNYYLSTPIYVTTVSYVSQYSHTTYATIVNCPT